MADPPNHRSPSRSANLLSVACIVFGVGVWTWAVRYSGFRDAEGFLQNGFCLALAVGAAAILLGIGYRVRAGTAAAWGSLALIGQAVALQMVVAGPVVAYQHYLPLADFFSAPRAYLTAILVVQFCIVGLGIRSHWAEIKHHGQLVLGRWQWAVGIGAIIITSATLSRDPAFYLTELGLAGVIQLVNLGTVVLAVRAVPTHVVERMRALGDRILSRATTPARGSLVDLYAVAMAGWIVVAAIVLSTVAYERHPHLADDVVYLMHAKYFAEGLLSMPAPPSIDAFDVHLMMYETNRWYSPVPPGWPAILAVGSYLGAPWLVNPILAGINALLAYMLVHQLYGRRTARIVLLLLSASPWFVYMAVNFLTHTFTLTCGMAAAVALARMRATRRLMWGWASGAAIGAASLVRPLEGLAMAIILGLWALPVRGRLFRFSPVACVAAGAILVGAIQLGYNQRITGDPGTFPIMAYTDSLYGPGTNALGFGPDRGLGWAGLDPLPGHGPIDVVINTNLNGFAVNIELLGWSTGSLLFVLFLVLSGSVRGADWFMLGWLGTVVGIHSFYYFAGGPDFGARYWFLIVVPTIVLTVRGVEALAGSLSRRIGSSTVAVRVGLIPLALSAAALLNFFPWRAIDKYHHYRGMRPGVQQLAKEYDFGRGLVFIRGPRIPDYASAVVYSPVNPESDEPIYALLKNPGVRAPVVDAYPDRPIWIVDGPTRTGAGYQVVAGPVSAADPRARQP